MEEKMLIKRNKLNIFQKISLFIKSIFNEENKVKMEYVEKINYHQSEMIDEFRRKREILNLQENYEARNILEKDITGDRKEELISLYKEQIKTLEENIAMYEKELEEYKRKIIAAKRKVEVNN